MPILENTGSIPEIQLGGPALRISVFGLSGAPRTFTKLFMLVLALIRPAVGLEISRRPPIDGTVQDITLLELKGGAIATDVRKGPSKHAREAKDGQHHGHSQHHATTCMAQGLCMGLTKCAQDIMAVSRLGNNNLGRAPPRCEQRSGS